jgi:hypothetical protein
MVVYIVINPQLHSYEALAIELVFTKIEDAQKVITNERELNGVCDWFVYPLDVKD